MLDLTALRAKASCHFLAASNSFNQLWQKPWSTLSTVIVIAIALTLPALFYVLSDNLKQFSDDLQRNGHISLYLKTSLSAKDEEAILKTIRAIPGVAETRYTTRAQSLAKLQEQEGMQDLMRYLPENPLPAVIEVVTAPALDTPEKVNQLFVQLQQLPEVEQAKTDLEWVNRLHATLSFLSKIGHAVMFLLASAVVLIVYNTLRLAIRNRHEEIQVLKLIGATDAFIVRPFLYSGVWYGVLGAVFAVFFVNVFMFSVAKAFHALVSSYHMHYPLLGLSVTQAYLIVVVAFFLGWLGAIVSVKGQLASIEPYS